MRRRGFTLIEITITLMIGAIVAAVAISGVQSLTDAHLRGAAVELTGAIKMSYDRAVMLKRTQRIAFDLSEGVWWIEYSNDPFSLSAQRIKGEEEAKTGDEDEEEEDERFGRFSFEEIDGTVKTAIEGGKAASFTKDGELDAGKPTKLPSGVCFSRFVDGHREDPFDEGIVYMHFFSGGWTEAVQIELVERDCDERVRPEDDRDTSYVTLRVLPLTGRVRTYHRQLERPDFDEVDGRLEGDL